MAPAASPLFPQDGLADTFSVLAHPLRLRLLHRLCRPAFVPDLRRELDVTRQALQKHLDALEAAGLVRSGPGRRGVLPAREYRTDAAGVFAFKESVLALAVRPPVPAPLPTVQALGAAQPHPRRGPGLLVVHGDAPGRWLPLAGRASWLLGRDPRADVPLAHDPFASQRHAVLESRPEGWRLLDLHATNPTQVNFERVEPGRPRPVRHGDLLTVGRTHLLLQDGSP